MNRRSLHASLVVALVVAGCHRHRGGGPRRVRDPRAQYATGCVDPRYVSAPSGDVAVSTDGDVTGVATAALRAQRAVAFSNAAGVTLAREIATPVRVTGPVAPDGFALAATGERFLLTWIDARTSALQLAAIAADGAAEAWPPFSRAATSLALSAGRDSAYVAWTEGAGDRATLRGAPLDARGRPRAEPSTLATGAVDAPAVTFTGMRYVVAWRARGAAIEARAVSRDGVAEAPTTLVEAPEIGRPSIAWGGDRMAVAWSDRRNGDLGLQITTRTLAGPSPGDVQRLSVRFERDARASIVWDGAAFGVTWWEPVGGGAPRSYMALVDRAGRRMGTSMRLVPNDDASLALPVIGWERPDYFFAAVRGATTVEARRAGPRGCDMPPAPEPPR